MTNPSNATQTIVTLSQIKDILVTTTATTIVKIKVRRNNTWQMKTKPGAIAKTRRTIKEKSNLGNNTSNNKQKSETKIYEIVTKQIHLP